MQSLFCQYHYLRNRFILSILTFVGVLGNAQEISRYVNPFIGTSNFGATNPGAVAPRGMVSVSPFNVSGKQNTMDKDSQWLSTPYVKENHFLTGFSHVNLSGVGCPDLGVLIAMPTIGVVETDPLKYGSTYSAEVARAGYYKTHLEASGITVETTATPRVGISRYTFPKGKSNVLLNLGLGLTNEQGAMVKVVSPTEIEGVRTVGSFCYYKPEETYPIYFVARFDKPAREFGIWKHTQKYKGVEGQWMGYNGKTRTYRNYYKEVVGDSIGTYFSYDFKETTQLQLSIGISYVSIENARENLEKELGKNTFESVYSETRKQWDKVLGRIEVSGGTENEKTIFYTALYHTLLHPNILNDYNGEYPAMATRETKHTTGNRFTVFSFWDTYRNLHALMSLLYPKQQSDMVKSMLAIYKESGWLPKWELNATETTTMVGDPAGIVIADTYLRGIDDFDIEVAYEAMCKSADQITDNPLRPGLEDYLQKGYLTTSTTSSGSVSTTQEYNISDFAIAQLAQKLGKKEAYERYTKRAVSYRKLFDKKLNLLRPKNDDGSWYHPFNPDTGANFVKNFGFIEGNSWQYTFMVTHDIPHLIKMMGGKEPFTKQLKKVFDNKQFDMANEPDIAYPFLFNYVKGKERLTQDMVDQLRTTYFKNSPDGLPGNDDTGTMSAWLIYTMMGIYPVSPAEPIYTISRPVFDRVTIHLDPAYYEENTLIIKKEGNPKGYIKHLELGGKKHEHFFITHDELTRTGSLTIYLK
ncbi:glycoside hydrolase family 92 protein [Aquimarina sp. TRL1]|uniref:GH92 family glycosyl hydrolase n=1 Tax=Aquimarina sp. (strain TRL1) TaxID=2736252 RepID=UPI00158B3D26|nr:GH92 family glycosyl hydrolase [Aquimarina sp. TRL1]QKX06660.1 glycoside hydrolase family 92 protein [Aquimarina sp. TRL1]